MQDVSGAAAAEVVDAFVVVRDGFELAPLYAQVDALDNRIDGEAQLAIYQAIGRLIQDSTAWHLKNGRSAEPLAQRIGKLRSARTVLEPNLGAMLAPFSRDRLGERTSSLKALGAPDELAARLAFLGIAELVPDIALVASLSGAEPLAAARAFFGLTDAFRIGRIEDAARGIQPADYYDGLALSRANDMIGAARRRMAVAALSASPGEPEPVAAWLAAGGARVARARERLQALTEGSDLTVSRMSVASGLMADIAGS